MSSKLSSTGLAIFVPLLLLGMVGIFSGGDLGWPEVILLVLCCAVLCWAVGLVRIWRPGRSGRGWPSNDVVTT
jgi:hypothetical protein